MITTISYSQMEILSNIIRLYCPKNCIDMDPTYSKGGFYNTGIPTPKYISDINPINKNIKRRDCTNLYDVSNNSVNSIIYDPPFLATTGPSLKLNNNSNSINKRFSVFPNEKELHGFFVKSLIEFYRVLDKNGVLIVKCQDKVSSGIQYMSHVFIINQAEKIGFYTKDLFILLAKNRIVANWQRKQQHARKYHCYFLVFIKNKKCVKYLKDE